MADNELTDTVPGRQPAPADRRAGSYGTGWQQAVLEVVAILLTLIGVAMLTEDGVIGWLIILAALLVYILRMLCRIDQALRGPPPE